MLVLLLAVGCSAARKDVAPDQRRLGILTEENDRLRELTRDQKMQLAKRDQLTRLLEEELSATKRDLEQVERQFVSMEKGLIRDETKASAVATISEVRLLLDNLKKQTPLPIDEKTLVEVESKLASANTLTRKRNYSAAVYYADRARRLLNQGERRHEALRNRMTIAVSRANLRGGPGTSYNVIALLERGTIVLHLEEKDRWYRVRTDAGTEGWVHKTLLR